MGLLNGVGQILEGAVTLNPMKMLEGGANVVSAPFQAASALLMGGGQQSLTGSSSGTSISDRAFLNSLHGPGSYTDGAI